MLPLVLIMEMMPSQSAEKSTVSQILERHATDCTITKTPQKGIYFVRMELLIKTNVSTRDIHPFR